MTRSPGTTRAAGISSAPPRPPGALLDSVALGSVALDSTSAMDLISSGLAGAWPRACTARNRVKNAAQDRKAGGDVFMVLRHILNHSESITYRKGSQGM